jgi:peptide-methionine (R)-S-oxide reductase
MQEENKISEERLKEKLSSEEYDVLRRGATEAPYSGQYVHTKDKGMYKCKVCGTQLFSSDVKFDSGTGWPSFDSAIPGSVELIEDRSHGMVRTEVRCKKCGSHLGHVFDDPSASSGQVDGPILRQDGKPVTKRYCINSVCLDLEKEE